MQCEVCDWPAVIRVWVRPAAGGRRKGHAFCCEECKQTGLRVLAVAGYIETHAVLGWDVFIPIWRDE